MIVLLFKLLYLSVNTKVKMISHNLIKELRVRIYKRLTKGMFISLNNED